MSVDVGVDADQFFSSHPVHHHIVVFFRGVFRVGLHEDELKVVGQLTAVVADELLRNVNHLLVEVRVSLQFVQNNAHPSLRVAIYVLVQVLYYLYLGVRRQLGIGGRFSLTELVGGGRVEAVGPGVESGD